MCNENNRNCNCNNDVEYEDNDLYDYNGTEQECQSQIEYIPMNISNLCKDNTMDIQYDESKFKDGVNDYSYIAGALTALLNTGLSPELAVQYILAQDEIKQNIKMTKINTESNEKVAERQQTLMEKNSL
jgi:hypothetical protein